MSEMMITNSLVKIREAPPYTPELKVPVMVCATLDAKTGGYSFPKKLVNEVTVNKVNAKTIVDIIADTGSSAGIEVDQGIARKQRGVLQ
jgi:fatty acid synthase subunit alpha, fungi type